VIDAAAAVFITALLVVHYLRGNQGIDTSWVILAGPALLYHAVVVYRHARGLREGEKHSYHAMQVLTAVKIAGWLGLVIWKWGNAGLTVLALVMIALKIGELGIYMRAGRERRPDTKSGRA
jgi:hypothetical protein